MARIPNRRSYKALTTKQYKGIDNAWLAPNGKLYDTGYMNHNEWASDYIFDKLCGKDWDKQRAFEKEIGGNYSYPYQILHNLGWYRLLTWSGPMTQLLSEGGKKLTSDQEDTLMFWCSANKVSYDYLITNGFVKM